MKEYTEYHKVYCIATLTKIRKSSNTLNSSSNRNLWWRENKYLTEENTVLYFATSCGSLLAHKTKHQKKIHIKELKEQTEQNKWKDRWNDTQKWER